jgi:hypothetical protein
VVTEVTSSTVIYTDPPGSGAVDDLRLVSDDPNPVMRAVVLGGGASMVWTESCVMPAIDSALCGYLLREFITWVDNDGSSQARNEG